MSLDVGSISGQMKLGLAQWTSNVNKAVADIARVDQAVDKGLGTSSKSATASIAELGKTTATTGSQAGNAQAPFKSLTKALEAAAKKAKELAKAEEALAQKARAAAEAVAAAAATKRQGWLSLSSAVSPAIGQLSSGISSIGAAATAAGLAVSVAIPVIAGLVAAGAAMSAAFNFGIGGIKLAADIEQVSLSFEVMLGSATEAKTLMADLKRFADTTPFAFPEIAASAKQLLAMGIAGKDVVSSLRRLGDVSALLGQPLGEMAYLFGQIKSQGQAMTQDLNQFAGRGVPIYGELAKVLGTTELGVRQLAESGQIGFAEIEKAIISMTSAGGKFFGGTEKLAESLGGKISTLSDAWTALQTAVGAAIAENLDLNEVVGELTELVVELTPAIEAVVKAATLGLHVILPLIEKVVDLVDMSLQGFEALLDKAGVGEGFRQAMAGFQILAAERKSERYRANQRAKKNADQLTSGGVGVGNRGVAPGPGVGVGKRAAAPAAAAEAAKSGSTVPATPVNKSADKKTDRQKRDQDESLARAAKIEFETFIRDLRAKGDTLRADLYEAEYRARQQFQKAVTAQERDAIVKSFELEKAEIQRRYAAKGASAKPSASPATSAQAGSATTSNAASRASAAAEMLPEPTGPAVDNRRLMDQLKHVARYGSGSAKALAQLDLREQLGRGLSGDQQRRQSRLREMMGVVPSGAATAGSAASGYANAKGGSAGGGAAAAPVINASVTLDADRVGKAAAAALAPLMDQKLNAMEARLRAESHRNRTAGGL